MAEVTAHLSAALAHRYRILRHLGDGGMATVYLAEDVKHDRKVAIKVLRPELAAVIGAERFLSEIKTTANLQHPHIVPLFDSGESDSYLFYVMPFIEGESLRERLTREKVLPVPDAVRIAREVSDGLDYAHRHGVVHRDIKPENILLHDGCAMIADFGIALAASKAGETRMTQTGMSLGTPSYMSPEQAMGERDIGPRSDIYSLGVMTYEMLVGDPPFTGSTAQAIVAKAMTEKPVAPTRVRDTIPKAVEGAVLTALQKQPADRFESAKAFAEALHNSRATAPIEAPKRVEAGGQSFARFLLPLSVAIAVITVALAAWGLTHKGQKTSVARYPTTLDAPGTLDGLTFAVDVALSPDGSSLVFPNPLTGPGQLYIKRRDEAVARPLAGTEGGSGPFFSPDGAWIGFVANGQLRRIPSAGGASLKIADSIDPIYNRGAWLDDGSIVYYDLSGHTLNRLEAGDVSAKVIASPAKLEGRYPWLPSPLPDSRGILFTAHLTLCVGPVSCRPSRVYVYDARQDTIRALFDDAIGAWYVPTGHVLYLTSAGTLMAVRWDNSVLAPSGKPVPVLDGIQAPGFVVSNEGTAYYLLGRSEFAPAPLPNAAVVWVDRSGHVEPVDSSWQVNTGGTDNGSIGLDWGLALSPDGRRIAISLLTELGTDIWIKQLPNGPSSRLTLYAGMDRSPAWTPDGRSVTFLSDRPTSSDTTQKGNRFNVWEQPADGTGEPRLLWAKDSPTDAFWSPDRRWMMLGESKSAGGAMQGDVVAMQPGVDSAARGILTTGYDEQGATLSPDGHWLAYVSNEQGANEVFVRPFPNVTGGKWQLSSGGGSAPLWSHSGRELFYVANGKMQVVRVNPGATFSSEPPRALFTIPSQVRAGSLASRTFAISPDDQRFLMVRDNNWADMAGTPQLVVVQNFFEELQAKFAR